MSRAIFVSVVVVLTTGSALAQPAPSAPPGHQAGEESAVLAALDRYVHAISAKDLRTMAAMQTPDGMTYVARPKEGGGTEIVCGVDVFDLIKIDGEWRVSNSIWTVEPDACTELRPADASQLRPEG